MGWVSAIPDETAEMTSLDKFLDLILKGLTLLGRVSGVLVVPTLLSLVGVVWADHLPWRKDQLDVEGLVQNPPPLVVRGVYLENRIGRSWLSRRRSFL